MVADRQHRSKEKGEELPRVVMEGYGNVLSPGTQPRHEKGIETTLSSSYFIPRKRFALSLLALYGTNAYSCE